MNVKIVDIIKLEHTEVDKCLPLGTMLTIMGCSQIPEGYVEITDSNRADIIEKFRLLYRDKELQK